MTNSEIKNNVILRNNWKIIDNDHLFRKFIFKDFNDSINFVNNIAKIANKLDHHPNIYIAWGIVEIKLQTHDLSKITNKDYILAEEIENLFNKKNI